MGILPFACTALWNMVVPEATEVAEPVTQPLLEIPKKVPAPNTYHSEGSRRQKPKWYRS